MIQFDASLTLWTQDFPLLMYAFVFVMGGCIGSFLNVCACRIPEGRSIITPGSQCQCGQSIKWFYNIPVLGWLILRGRADCCKARISIQYPLVEVVAAALFVLCWWHFAPIEACLNFVFISFLIIGTLTDLEYMIIPDSVTIGGLIFALLVAFAFPFLSGRFMIDDFVGRIYALVMAFACACVVSGCLFWFSSIASWVLKREAMGLADIKLIGFISAFAGWKVGLASIFLSSLLACFFLVPLMIYQKMRGKALHGQASWQKHLDEDPALAEEESQGCGLGLHIPFGPWLSLGALICVFLEQFYLSDWLFQ